MEVKTEYRVLDLRDGVWYIAEKEIGPDGDINQLLNSSAELGWTLVTYAQTSPDTARMILCKQTAVSQSMKSFLGIGDRE